MADDKVIVPPAEGAASAATDQVAEMKKLVEQLNGSIGNLKAEMNRKIDSLRPAPPPAPARKPMADLLYEDPEAAVNEIADRVTSKVNAVQNEREYRKGVSQKLYTDYPELKDPAHPLSVRADEIFSGLSEAEKSDPRALRAAVLEAASEITLAPKAKRKQAAEQNTDDNFSLGGGGNAPRGGRRGKKEELAPETLEAAALMGLDTSDPKVVERLEKRAQRSFGKYGG